METLTPDQCDEIAAFFLTESSNLENSSAFIDLYRDLTSPGKNAGTSIPVGQEHLKDHKHVQEVAGYLRQHTKQFRRDLYDQYFPDFVRRPNESSDPVAVIVQLSFMLDCNLKDRHSKNRRVNGWEPSRWENTESFEKFVSKAIPENKPMLPSSQDRRKLAAWKLKKRCNIVIEGTDRLEEHLLYNDDNNTLKIFHHTTWLQAQLQKLSVAGEDLQARESQLTLDQSLKAGALPRQLVLETLDSFHRILFHLRDDRSGRSGKLLEKLIGDEHFDPNATERSDGPPEGFQYHYWGARIAALIELYDNPPASFGPTKWVEQHKDERNVMWAAIIGLFLAAFFGLITSLLGAAQLGVAIVALQKES